MEILFEILFELIFEGSIEISSNKKISKWIRYPLIAIIILFFLTVIGIIILTGVLVFYKSNIIGIILILIGVLLLIASILKFRKIYLSKKG